jgi:F0F1-type ATP synthase membrane subunit c/vacuolar-type H+-ATPase subunit K
MGRNLSLILIFGLSLLGACFVFAAVSYASINALGRNPSSAPKIFTALVIALLFTFLMTFVAMLIVFQLFSPSG